MSAVPLPVIGAPTVVRRPLASVEVGGALRSQARRHVVDVLRLVALSIDAKASSGAARDAKDATLRLLVAEVAATSATAVTPETATVLRALDADAGLTRSADRVVELLRHVLSAEDVSGILREVVTTRWADGQRLQCDPAVALSYAARLLAPSSTRPELERLRRPGLIRRVLPHRKPAAVRRLRPVAAMASTWRQAGDPVVPGVRYLPFAAQAAAQRRAGVRPLAAVAGDDFTAA